MSHMETWQHIAGTQERYSVSNEGRVRSEDRVVVDCNGRERKYRGQVLKPWLSKHGYQTVCLSIDGRNIKAPVHIQVAEAFCGPRTAPTVNHADSNKLNNHWRNLEWMTLQENLDHALKTGSRHGRTNPRRAKKLTAQQVDSMHAMHAAGWLQREIAATHSVSQSQVSLILKGKQWKSA